MPVYKILVVEDEIKLAEALGDYLTALGYEVLRVGKVADAKAALSTFRPHLMLLDWMLPDGSGDVFLKTLRQETDLPVIMLTARVEENDVVQGFECGADDYVTKPFSMKQLSMRIQAVLRRGTEPLEDTLSSADGRIMLRTSSREVLFNQQGVALTPSEYNLLATLLKHPQKVFTREELIFAALGEDYEGVDRTVDTFIKNIRQKLMASGLEAGYIETVHGVGYRMGAVK